MAEPSASKDDFLYPYTKYRGEFSPENLAFDANLQEFAQRVSYVCTLETTGKLTQEEAYQRIRELWKTVKKSRKGLGIDE